MTNQVENYIFDLGILLKEKAKSAKIEKELSHDIDEINYNLGYLMAFHDVLSLMKQQAEVFGINAKIIGLADIDPDKELL